MAFRRVTVYDSVIKSEFRAGGMVYREAARKMQIIETAAIAGAPTRSGLLKRSHYRQVRGSNQYVARGVIGNNAPHASFVAEGTRTPIVPIRGPYLILPRVKGMRSARDNGTMLIRKKAVRGQAANDWISRAVERLGPL